MAQLVASLINTCQKSFSANKSYANIKFYITAIIYYITIATCITHGLVYYYITITTYYITGTIIHYCIIYHNIVLGQYITGITL